MIDKLLQKNALKLGHQFADVIRGRLAVERERDHNIVLRIIGKDCTIAERYAFVEPQAPDPRDKYLADAQPESAWVLRCRAGNGFAVSTLMNKGGGLFGPRVEFAVPTLSRWPVIADVNQDGKLDIAVAVATGLSILINRCM